MKDRSGREPLPSSNMRGENGEENRCGDSGYYVLMIALAIAFFGIIIGCAVEDIRGTIHPPQYSMSITGVAGLDLDDRRPALSPVFNLTLRISNTRYKYWTCVPELSMASVSYRDAFLGKGSLEPFCAGPKGESEGRARAWGQDVAVPRFLQDQLAGELQRGDAAVDVVVKVPAGCNAFACFDKVLVCKAKIRGGLPCWMSVRETQH